MPEESKSDSQTLLANPYLAFSAMMMAGLDGIQNKIHPGDGETRDLYDLTAQEEAKIPQVACFS
jgi:glutamine synthetase